ncbi:zinc-dependent alcohol dehydrogenase family protein [Streptomyces sp. SLBN-31]|uniref:zinc-dependent alcohol dehydrogenase family protein n=1 Tax=Streptomyces sp. SLBN-31 TaxID=2768444 RepID=UPI0011513CEA|nr:zinc-dependent alcohol dehydrogenase family protein [Streptomyces sp. SLBN-31]TQJ92981.1 2-desacetyl-2-hydroxyethyl bacteriochlorophyllide A dehydrogenase [Streptomyces sp. SLBN-31]
MKAAIITEPGKIEIGSLPDPAPGPREVVVAVAGTGICGTDLHILDGEIARSFPVVPGHEFAGEVVAVGREVTEVRTGDHVAVNPSIHCGECYYCGRARANLCERWESIGITKPGGAAEYALAPVKNCFVLPEGVSTADAALIEPLGCAVRGFDVLSHRLGDHYLIYGAGTMGLMMMELAKRAGAASVTVVDPNPSRLETTRLLGCTAAVTAAGEANRPRGWDIVIDCTGVVAAIEDGLSRVERGGTFLQFGVASPEAKAAIEPFRIYNHEITITGSMALLNSFDRAGALFAAGLLRPDVLISHRFSLDEYKQAVDLFKQGMGRKIQIQPNGPAR